MSQYQASIGRSSYEIPYESHDDLPLLQTLCKDVNRIVNSVIASNPTVSNEFAILLALINTIYESKHSEISTQSPINDDVLQHSNAITETVDTHAESETKALEDCKGQNPHEKNGYSTQDVLEIIEFLQKKI